MQQLLQTAAAGDIGLAAAARTAAATAAASSSEEDEDDDEDNSLHADADSDALDQEEDDAASSTSTRSSSSRSSRSSTSSLSNRNTHAEDVEDSSNLVDGCTGNGSNHPGSDSNTSSSNRHSNSSNSSNSSSSEASGDDDNDTYTPRDQVTSSNKANSSKAYGYDFCNRSFSYKIALSGLSYLTGVAAAEAINHGHYQLLKQMKEAGWLEGMEPAHLAPALRAAAAAAAAATTSAAFAAPAVSDGTVSSITTSTTAAAVGGGAAVMGSSTAPAAVGAAAAALLLLLCSGPQTAGATTPKRPAAAAAAKAHANASAAAQLLLETYPHLLQISYDTYNQGNFIQKVQLLSLAADLYYSNSFRNIQLRRVAAGSVQNPAMMLMDVCRRAQQDPKVVQLLLDLKVCTSMQRVYYVPSDAPCRFDEGFFEYNGPILAAAIAERSSGPVVALMEAGAKLPVPRGKAASQGLGLSSALGVLLGGMIDGLLGPGPLPFDHDDLTAVMDQLRQQQQQVAADDGDGRGSTADGGRYICCCFV